MGKKAGTSSFANAFIGTVQGRVAMMIALVYTIGTILFGLCPGHIVGAILKLGIFVYTINCMVAGNCNSLGWFHVLSLVLFCAADIAGLIHMDSRLRSVTGGGLFGGSEPDANTYAEARDRMGQA